jgi:hypothetical protein
MTKFIVDVDLNPREAEKLLNDALIGIFHSVDRVEKVGALYSAPAGALMSTKIHLLKFELEDGTELYAKVTS